MYLHSSNIFSYSYSYCCRNFLKSLGNKASTMAKGVVLYIASNNSQESLENEFMYVLLLVFDKYSVS